MPLFRIRIEEIYTAEDESAAWDAFYNQVMSRDFPIEELCEKCKDARMFCQCD